MVRDDDNFSRGGAAAEPTSAEAADKYRSMVGRLVSDCIKRVIAWRLPHDCEPLLQWRPRRD
jgi:hypothetical protein